MLDVRSIETGSIEPTSLDRDIDQIMPTSSSSRRRRSFQRQACFLSVMAAFSLGLALGVFVPLIGMSSATIRGSADDDSLISIPSSSSSLVSLEKYSSVSFVTEEKLRAEQVFRNAFHLKQNTEDDTMTVKKLDPADGSIKEFTVHRTADGYFRKGPEIKISKPSVAEQILSSTKDDKFPTQVEFIQHNEINNNVIEDDPFGVIENDIYWGATVEEALPKGFEMEQADEWNKYVENNGIAVRLEAGCGRMQNRMVIFQDGKRACARYRQNTDQIQGELFSFYLGSLLNLTNLAPSTASVIDLNLDLWSSTGQDISNAQWKVSRPVVLTKWVPDLEPAGIPLPFQPLERHLNKLDVNNITLGLDIPKPPRGLLDRLGAVQGGVGSSSSNNNNSKKNQQEQPIRPPGGRLTNQIISKLIELAQWSDLIVFDYLIANLDRVVNNLYNYQWNADIMAAPAHNLAKQTESQLLVFLDNESGLLHGYRLLKKYEAYHGLLLDNLCVFRKPTIDALQKLQSDGVGKRLQDMFEKSTNHNIRDVLPPLPEKSIKILNDRVDRVLGQVQKCRELFSSR